MSKLSAKRPIQLSLIVIVTLTSICYIFPLYDWKSHLVISYRLVDAVRIWTGSAGPSLTENPSLLIENEGCQIFNLSPFESSMMKQFDGSMQTVCEAPLILVDSDNKLVWNEGQLSKKYEGENITCCVRSIERLSQNPQSYTDLADSLFRKSEECISVPPSGTQEPYTEFVQVECKVNSEMILDPKARVLPPTKQSKKTLEKVNVENRQFSCKFNPKLRQYMRNERSEL